MVRNLRLQAKLKPLLIGSLPFQSPEEALEVVFRYCPRSPSWPQLPKLSIYESMSLQYLEGIPGWEWDGDNVTFIEPYEISNLNNILDDISNESSGNYKLSEKFSLTFNLFIEKIKSKKDIDIIKGQVIGPITFLTTHKKKNGQLLISDEFYKDIIPKLLNLKADNQFESFKTANLISEKIIFFDEPVLSQIGSAVLNLKKEDIKEIYESILCKKRSYFVGMHICGNSEWDFIMSLPIDILNFDAYNYLEEFFLYEVDIKKFLEKGGYLAFGIIPTDSDILKGTSSKELVEKIDYVIKKLKEITKIDHIEDKIFITPSCGMGALSIDESIKVLELLKSIR